MKDEILRVLHFGRFDHQTFQGGVQYYALSLSRSLPAKIQTLMLVSSLTGESYFRQETNCEVFAEKSYGMLASVPLSPGIFWRARQLLKTRQIDLIHLNFPDPLAMIVCLLLRPKQPMVVLWHSDVVKQKWAFAVYLPLLKLFMKRVSKVIVATPKHISSCPQLTGSFPRLQDIQVIPFGIEARKLLPATSVPNPFPGIEKPRVLFTFGRHVYYKGYSYLLEALAKVENKKACLVIGGKGPLTEELKKQTQELGLAERVHFTGRLSEEEIQYWLEHCEFFCFPSITRIEAFGYAQVEAMLAGKPVICCELNNGVTYVNIDHKTGLVVPPKDAQALTQAMDLLLRDDKMRELMGAEAKRRVEAEFILEKMAQRTSEVYFEILQERSLASKRSHP